MRRILLDADMLVEFFINRGVFQEKVEDIFEIINIKGVEFYLSNFGFEKIRDITKVMSGHKASKEITLLLKRRFGIKILTVTKQIIDEARLLHIENFDSSLEVSLAINSNISAIITHKISDFFGSELNVCSLTDFQERENLEKIFSKETSSRPMVLNIKDEIATLNHFYDLPSHLRPIHASEESLKIGKTHRKLLIPHDITSPFPLQDPSHSIYRDLIVRSLRLAIDKELLNPTSAAFASLKSVTNSFTALYPLQDLSQSKYRDLIAKSSRLAIDKELLNPTSAAFASLKSVTDSFTALYPLQDLSRSKYKDLIAKSSRLAIDKELLNPTSAAFASLKSVTDSFGKEALNLNR